MASTGKTFNEGCHGIYHDLDDHGQGWRAWLKSLKMISKKERICAGFHFPVIFQSDNQRWPCLGWSLTLWWFEYSHLLCSSVEISNDVECTWAVGGKSHSSWIFRIIDQKGQIASQTDHHTDSWAGWERAEVWTTKLLILNQTKKLTSQRKCTTWMVQMIFVYSEINFHVCVKCTWTEIAYNHWGKICERLLTIAICNIPVGWIILLPARSSCNFSLEIRRHSRSRKKHVFL